MLRNDMIAVSFLFLGEGEEVGGEGVIELHQVSWRRQDHWVLREVNWQVREGEHWCLFGMNGSGKTTLLNLINGYIWPTAGSVTVLGRRFGQVDLRELRKLIGWVSSSLQAKLPGSDRVEEIVLSGKYASIGLYDQVTEEERAAAREWLSLMGCLPYADRAYHTLSQGEQQRVLIARALMANPRLLILDEPCSGLDLLGREQLLATIEQLARRPDAPTLIYVTHHLEEVLPCFTHTLLLRDGQVFQTGQTEELFQPEVLSQFLGVPIDVQRWQQRYWVMLRADQPPASIQSE